MNGHEPALRALLEAGGSAAPAAPSEAKHHRATSLRPETPLELATRRAALPGGDALVRLLREYGARADDDGE